jgi:hypothetical protein
VRRRLLTKIPEGIAAQIAGFLDDLVEPEDGV